MASFAKKRQLQHLFVLRDANQISDYLKEQSLAYRQRILQVANLFRLIAILLIVLFGLLFSGYGEQGEWFIWTKDFPTRSYVLIIGGLYIFTISILTIKIIPKNPPEWIFLLNAILDIILLIALSLNLNIGLYWTSFLSIGGITMTFSVLSLSTKQSIIYCIFIYILFVMAFCSDLKLGEVNGLGRFFSYTLPENWISGCLVLALACIILFLFGFFSDNAQQGEIKASMNRFSYLQSRRLNESIIAEMPNGILVVNEQGEIIVMNKYVKDIFHITEAYLPKTLHNLSPLLNQLFRLWQEKKYQELQTIDIFNDIFTATFQSLEIRGYHPLIMVSLENIEVSYQRVRETRLVSLGRLSAGIAHEIRNPLGTVQTANELIEEILEEEEGLDNVKNLCHKIAVNSKRINTIISNILSVFDNRPKNIQPVYMVSFLRQTIKESQTDRDLEHIPITFKKTSSSEFFVVHFDPGHLAQIIHNLMLNSVKHCGVENVEITIKLHGSSDGHLVYLDIEDNGVGINEKDRDNIFEPFYSKKGSTGLGLYLVRELCLANHAQIAVMPKDGGACFRITMDLSKN